MHVDILMRPPVLSEESAITNDTIQAHDIDDTEKMMRSEVIH